MKKYLLLFSLLSFLSMVQAQQSDTLLVKPEHINTSILIPGTHRWLVYFKAGKDSSRTRFNIWTRKIDMIQYRGKEAVSVTQEWENNDTILHTVYTVCDRKDFSTLYQKSWSKTSGTWEFDFIDKTFKLNGTLVDATDTLRVHTGMRKAFESATGQYTLDWHLDLEVFPLLPYQAGRVFGINYYDPGFSAPKLVYYTVTGSAVIKGYNGQDIDCWLLSHDASAQNHELFYISKKTKEVLQLEQEYGGRYRYKVKLAFSN